MSPCKARGLPVRLRTYIAGRDGEEKKFWHFQNLNKEDWNKNVSRVCTLLCAGYGEVFSSMFICPRVVLGDRWHYPHFTSVETEGLKL